MATIDVEKKIPVKKIRHGQLRGTVAAKYRHRISLGFTLGSLAMSFVFGYFFYKTQPNPNRGLDKIEHPKKILQKMGYKSIMERDEVKINEDSL